MSSKRMSPNERIKEKLAQAEALMKECEAIANAGNVSFHINGPAYGMGGYYNPVKSKEKPVGADEDWEASDDDGQGWQASSQGC